MDKTKKSESIDNFEDEGRIAFRKIQSNAAQSKTPYLATSQAEKVQLTQQLVERRQKQMREAQQRRNEPIKVAKTSATDQIAYTVGILYSGGTFQSQRNI